MTAPKNPTLDVRVCRLVGAPENLLDVVPVSAGITSWVGPDISIVGWGDALDEQFVGEHSMRQAARRWEDLIAQTKVSVEPPRNWGDAAASGDAEDSAVAPQFHFPIAMGSFGFSDSTPSHLVVPEVALVEDENGVWVVTANADGRAPDPAEVPLELQGETDAPTGLWTEPGRMTQNKWKEAVARLTRMLRSGIASKVVLARDIVVSSSAPIDERFLLQQLLDRYPNTWVYAARGLIGATPEMLASLRNEKVVSRVLAGTSAPGEGESLLSSLKDRSEHHLAVESVARSLGPLAEEITVPSEPGLLDLPNVTHLATEVEATVPGGNVLDIVDALHPTAAVCGTPTRLAYQIVDDLEGTRRGRYSGPVGWVDAAGEGDFGIALRCGQLSDDHQQIRVFAGGGIMPDSVPDLELAETRAKMKPVLQALGIED